MKPRDVHEGDEVIARTCGPSPPTYEERNVRVSGLAVDPPWPAGLVLVEFTRLGELCRGWVARSSVRVVARRQAPAESTIELSAGVDGVSWEPMIY